MSAFAALGLSQALVRATDELGYAQPTPVQAAAIPAVLAGRDVLAMAPTGSGKTAAYGLPLLQQLGDQARPATPGRAQARVLVLVPTRELAAQVDEALRLVRRFLARPLKVGLLHGGVSINPQLMALRGGADLVVATPGRLLDVVAHNGLDLAALRCLVLDEADRLLDAGFADETARVLALLPARRQSLLFSATFPAAVQAWAGRLLHEPVHVQVPRVPAAPPAPGPGWAETAETAATAQVPAAQAETPEPASPLLQERAIEVDANRRTPLLRHLLQTQAWSRVLVFVATRYACEHVADKLRRAGVAAAAFHGDASQGARQQALAAFKAGQLQVLVATDLGARGIDIAQLPVVVSYDLPRSAVDHVHRTGRTARAGAPGLAVSFVSTGNEAHFRLIEKRQGRRVPREQVAGFEPVAGAAPAAAPAQTAGGIKGRRPSKKDKLRAARATGA